jgi:hypothetical protein
MSVATDCCRRSSFIGMTPTSHSFISVRVCSSTSRPSGDGRQTCSVSGSADFPHSGKLLCRPVVHADDHRDRGPRAVVG